MQKESIPSIAQVMDFRRRIPKLKKEEERRLGLFFFWQKMKELLRILSKPDRIMELDLFKLLYAYLLLNYAHQMRKNIMKNKKEKLNHKPSMHSQGKHREK